MTQPGGAVEAPTAPPPIEAAKTLDAATPPAVKEADIREVAKNLTPAETLSELKSIANGKKESQLLSKLQRNKNPKAPLKRPGEKPQLENNKKVDIEEKPPSKDTTTTKDTNEAPKTPSITPKAINDELLLTEPSPTSTEGTTPPEATSPPPIADTTPIETANTETQASSRPKSQNFTDTEIPREVMYRGHGKEGKAFRQDLKAAMKAKANELGISVRKLPSDIELQVQGEISNKYLKLDADKREIEQGITEHENSIIRSQIEAIKKATGKDPDQETISMLTNQAIQKSILRETKQIINNPSLMKNYEGLTKKKLAQLIGFLIASLGLDFIKKSMPPTPRQ